MAIFTIIIQPSQNTALLPRAIDQTFPEQNIQIADEVWLVAAKITAKEISDKLKVTDGANGPAVILEVAGYFGRADPTIWSWMKSRLEAQ